MDYEKLVLDNQDKIKENNSKIFNVLVKDPFIINFLEENNMDEQFLKDHLYSFLDYYEANKVCNKCSSLQQCPFDLKGYKIKYSYDKILTKKFVRCDYLKANEYMFALEKNYRHYDFPKNDLLLKLSLIKPKKMSEEYNRSLKEIIKHIKSNSDKGLYMFGEVGVGKSYLLKCISNEFALHNKTVAYYSMAVLENNFKGKLFDNEYINDKISEMCRVDGLFFDDFGAVNMSDWVKYDIILQVVDHRLENHKPMYFSSNFNYDELLKLLTNKSNGDSEGVKAIRLLERIKTLTIPLQIKGNNLRRLNND
ncbi:MAG: ATP-binding protein [Erysipelotrichaceae bacterium]